jgi:predicted transcriptional regulator
MIQSYWHTIQEKHKGFDIPLHKVFIKAGLPTSTYYRTLNGSTELRYETAKKIMRVMELMEGAYPTSRDKRKLHAKVSKL